MQAKIIPDPKRMSKKFVQSEMVLFSGFLVKSCGFS